MHLIEEKLLLILKICISSIIYVWLRFGLAETSIWILGLGKILSIKNLVN